MLCHCVYVIPLTSSHRAGKLSHVIIRRVSPVQQVVLRGREREPSYNFYYGIGF